MPFVRSAPQLAALVYFGLKRPNGRSFSQIIRYICPRENCQFGFRAG